MEYLLLCLGMMVADNWISTDIKNHPDIYEGNPITGRIIGRHPSDEQFIAYAAVLGAVYTAGYYALPKPYAKGAAIVCAASHATAVYNNFQMGLKFNF